MGKSREIHLLSVRVEPTNVLFPTSLYFREKKRRLDIRTSFSALFAEVQRAEGRPVPQRTFTKIHILDQVQYRQNSCDFTAFLCGCSLFRADETISLSGVVSISFLNEVNRQLRTHFETDLSNLM